jgi:hypothetical protein
MTFTRSPGESAPERQLRDIKRWECHCQSPPVLLATYDESGAINIKARDRYWTVFGTVQAHCPLCGSEHTLDLNRHEADS